MSFKNGIHVSHSLTRHFTYVILQQCCFLSVSELFYFNDSYIIPNNFMPLYADCVNKSVSSVEKTELLKLKYIATIKTWMIKLKHINSVRQVQDLC